MRWFVILVTFLVCYVPGILISGLMPYITRRTESFGVSIPEERYNSPEVAGIRRSYRNKVLAAGSVISLLILAVSLVYTSELSYILLSSGIFILMPVMFILYLSSYKKMKQLKAEKKWTSGRQQMVVVDTGFRSRKVMISPAWFILYALVIAATLAFGFLMYDKMPDRIPMNYDYSGNATRWVDKSYKILLWAPVVQVFITMIMIFVYWIIGKGKQLIDPSNPEKSIEQNRIFRYRWSAFTVFGGLAMVLMFGFTLFSMSGLYNNIGVTITLPFIVSIGIVAAVIVLSFKTGQGGSRVYVKQGGKDESDKVISRDEDSFWKLGVFYYNPDDPAMFVEKRFGIGWTNNWARPMSWVLAIGFIILTGVLIVVTAMLVK